MRPAIAAIAFVALFSLGGEARSAGVDLEVILAADVSRSIDDAEFDLQRKGYVGRTVGIKLNLTGSPGLRFQGKPLGVTHYTHPKLVFAMTRVLSNAGARRIRFVESAWASVVRDRRPLRAVSADSSARNWSEGGALRAARRCCAS